MGRVATGDTEGIAISKRSVGEAYASTEPIAKRSAGNQKFEIGRLNIKYVKARLFKTCYGGR